MAWFKNKETGVCWEVTSPELLKTIGKSTDFVAVNSPDEDNKIEGLELDEKVEEPQIKETEEEPFDEEEDEIYETSEFESYSKIELVSMAKDMGLQVSGLKKEEIIKKIEGQR